MKNILLFVLSFIPLYGLSQSLSLSGTVTDAQSMPFPGVNIILLKDSNIIQSVQSNLYGQYLLDKITPGSYTIKLSYGIMAEKVMDRFEIKENRNSIDFIYPEPCKPAKQLCPKGHKYHIIPIVYGLPSKKMKNRAEKEKVKLGGCDSTRCERWHCKIHDIDF